MRLTIILVLLLSFQAVAAQKAIIDSIVVAEGVVTTDEEFNYITKGYKAQVIEQGGDLKRGYELFPIKQGVRVSNFTFDVKLFKRTTSQEVCALMVVVNSTYSGRTYYLCIPTNNETLLKRYLTSLNELDYSFQSEYGKVMSLMYSDLLIDTHKPNTKRKY